MKGHLSLPPSQIVSIWEVAPSRGGVPLFGERAGTGEKVYSDSAKDGNVCACLWVMSAFCLYMEINIISKPERSYIKLRLPAVFFDRLLSGLRNPLSFPAWI